MALDPTALSAFITSALAEDVGSGDHSTLACIPASARGKAQLKIKEDGILAGMEVAEAIFKQLDASSIFTPFKKDGDTMHTGEVAFNIEASVHTLLTGERLVLNCMQRMSGIATLTHQYVQVLQPYHTRILDTRKTTPNFRLLEKEAVRIGGGTNHRMGLYDMVMLKDNHVDFAGGIPQAVARTVKYLQAHQLDLKIEVETRNLEDVKQCLATGKVDRIMLDNYAPDQISAAMQLIQGQAETEASGGITLENIVTYAQTGVDYISAGAIIHHAVSLDLSLKAM